MMVKKLEKVSYEDALDMTGFGKFNYLMFALVGSMIMGMASEIFSVSFLVTASACELGTVSSQQGLIAGTPLVGIIASSHFWGYLADTQGRRKILCVSLMVGFCAGFIATFSPNWIVYMLLKFASSCGVAGTYALALTLLGECTPHTKRTTMIAYTTSIFLISTGSMAIITIPVLPLTFSYYIPYLNIHFNSWRLLNIIYCIPCALGALGVLKSYESPKYLLSVGEEEKALEILRGIHAINNGKDSEFKVTSVILDEERKKNVVGLWASLKSQTIPLLKPPLLKKTLLLSLLFIIVYFCLNPYMVWLPYIADGIMRAIERDDGNITFCQMLQTSLDVTKTQTSNCGLDQTAMVMVFCIDVFMAILNIILTTIMSCTGRKTLLISLQLLSGVAGLLVNLSSSWIVSNILFIVYVSGVLNFGFLATFVVDVFPTYVKAMAVCLCLMVGRGSSVLGINILKALLINHCQLSFYCFAGLTIEHIQSSPPCEVCPRKGICVPKVQCPAHVRPNSNNLLCHLEGSGSIGVCCFTGQHHAAESDRKMRTSTMSIEDMKSAHKLSHQKVADWLRTAEQLLKDNLTIVDNTAPSYGHYLSTVIYDERAKDLARGGLLNMFAAQELKSRQAISDDELALGLTDHTDGPYCPPLPSCPSTDSRYRTLRGECNNIKNPNWGAANTAFERLLPPDYSDGIWAIRKSSSDLPLPSSRTVSHRILLDASNPSRTHNLLFMQFGQFIAHDISAGVIYTAGDNKPISCCTGDGEAPLPPHLQHWACAPIQVEPNDPFFDHFQHRCINFVRAQLSPAGDCSIGYAKQMNGATHYPDLSHIYGSTKEKTDSLRAPGGLLKVFKDYGRDLPPATDRKECLTDKEGAVCFDSGDNHANQILSLTVLHTIWTREHNRVARILAKLNPKWTEDTVFMETRRILQAEFQHIIYNEWLPLLLGPQIMREFQLLTFPGYSPGYDPQVNPSLTVEFSAAAMRFGHSIVDGKIMVPNPKSGDIYETISIPEIMHQPSRLRLLPFLDRILIGLSMQPMQSVDPFVTEGLSRYMFRGVKPYGLDLAAINIQRGRDVGLRPYNHYRRLCGLKPFTDFKQFSPITAQRLSSVYQSPEDIDLWIGGLLEAPVEGGVVGPTFANIIADQFTRLKKGDRYFYDYGSSINPGAFTPSQLADIKKVTFSRLLCDNRDGKEFTSQTPNAFLRPDLPGNEPVPCDSPLISKVDLTKFREI